MKFKLTALILTLFLILALAPAAFADEAETVEDGVNAYCLDQVEFLHPETGAPHPVGWGIAVRYTEVSEESSEDDQTAETELSDPAHALYQQVMAWFCHTSGDGEGYGFGQIMLALQTSQILADTENSPDAQSLLEMRAEGMGWGEIWKTLGFNGKPKPADWTGGPPSWANAKDKEALDEDQLDSPKLPGPKEKDRKKPLPPTAGPKDK